MCKGRLHRKLFTWCIKKMGDTNDSIKQITVTLKKDREDANITKTKGEATINNIENKVDRLLNFVSYVGRYTEDSIPNENTGGNVVTNIRGVTQDNTIDSVQTNHSTSFEADSPSIDTGYVLPATFDTVALLLEH